MHVNVGIDPQVLEQVTGGNAALASRIVEQYMAVAGTEIDQLSEIVTQGDRAALRRQAHRVVGAAATVGAVGVERAARALEEATIEGSDVPLLSSLVERVGAAYGAISSGPTSGN